MSTREPAYSTRGGSDGNRVILSTTQACIVDDLLRCGVRWLGGGLRHYKLSLVGNIRTDKDIVILVKVDDGHDKR